MAIDQPRGCTNFKLRQLLRRVSLVYDHAMAECGLKITQYSLLTHVDRLGPITQADLARAMAMDSSTLSRNLKPLQTAGWIAVSAGDDARSNALELTDAGRRKRSDAQALWKKAQLQLNETVGVDDVIALHALIDRISDALASNTSDEKRSAA
uniref:Transcriptional regulator, MarR family n=1 Tax=uncultured bacterium A1Q1_fos_504 TaxID=1256580 RepID=L7VRW1_9BACT|nr:transcriptional regulator, MarR family [uncultured bacterium A1Q1_fos_504]